MPEYRPLPDPTPQRLAVLMSRVDRGPHCWAWSGPTAHGYGLVYMEGRRYRVHRLAYHWLVGPLDRTLTIDHTCRVRNCVRPEHLEGASRVRVDQLLD